MKKLNEQNTERVKEIIAEQVGTFVSEVTDTDNLKYALGMDSVDIVETVMKVENEFNIRIPDQEIEDVETVDDLCHKVALYL